MSVENKDFKVKDLALAEDEAHRAGRGGRDEHGSVAVLDLVVERDQAAVADVGLALDRHDLRFLVVVPAAPAAATATGLRLVEGGALLEELETETGVRCDEAPWRFAGLSFY